MRNSASHVHCFPGSSYFSGMRCETRYQVVPLQGTDAPDALHQSAVAVDNEKVRKHKRRRILSELRGIDHCDLHVLRNRASKRGLQIPRLGHTINGLGSNERSRLRRKGKSAAEGHQLDVQVAVRRKTRDKLKESLGLRATWVPKTDHAALR